MSAVVIVYIKYQRRMSAAFCLSRYVCGESLVNILYTMELHLFFLPFFDKKRLVYLLPGIIADRFCEILGNRPVKRQVRFRLFPDQLMEFVEFMFQPFFCGSPGKEFL